MKKSKKSLKDKLTYNRKAKAKLTIQKKRTGAKDKAKKVRDISEKEQIQLDKVLRKLEKAKLYDTGFNREEGGFAEAKVGDYDMDIIDVNLSYGIKGSHVEQEKIQVDRRTLEVLSSDSMATGGVVNDRMYYFLKDDLNKLEKAVSEGDKEEVERFFSYWGYHLKSLENKGHSKDYDRMYNFMKDDLKKLEKAIEENDKEEIDKFFSYWSIHLKSLKYASGGSMSSGGGVKGSGIKELKFKSIADLEKKHDSQIDYQKSSLSKSVLFFKNGDKFELTNLHKWENGQDEYLIWEKSERMSSGGYTKNEGKYQINVHGKLPEDYKIICRILRIDGKDTQVCYHERNDGSAKGVEVYSGKNYIVGSADNSYSKKYDLDEVPVKYKAIVDELKSEHHKRWGGKGSMASGGKVGERYTMGDDIVYVGEGFGTPGYEDEVHLFYEKDDSIIKSFSKKSFNKLIEDGKLKPLEAAKLPRQLSQKLFDTKHRVATELRGIINDVQKVDIHKARKIHEVQQNLLDKMPDFKWRCNRGC